MNKKSTFKIGFPRAASSKEPTCQCKGDERPGLIPGSGRSTGGGHGNPLQYSCLENPHGQNSLVGYSPQGCTELDTTEATQQALMPMQETQEVWVQFLCWEDTLEQAMAPHSSILVWEIPWTEEPGQLQSTVYGATKSQTQLNDRAHTHTFI